jgi:hypothetical protein
MLMLQTTHDIRKVALWLGQPVRTTALVQLGRDGQVAFAACIGGSKPTAPNPDTLGGTLRLIISSTVQNPN